MRASILVDAGRMFSRTLPFSIMDNFAMTIVDNRDNWMSTITAVRKLKTANEFILNLLSAIDK